MTVTDLSRYRRPDVSRLATIPEWVLVQEMDRARRVADDATRLHDTLAAELGFDRVRISDVKPGDVIASTSTGSWYPVESIDQKVDRSGIASWFVVTFADQCGTCEYDDGQLVSRQRPDNGEPF